MSKLGELAGPHVCDKECGKEVDSHVAYDLKIINNNNDDMIIIKLG